MFIETDDEVWRPVVGFEGHYEVSTAGRVRSLKTGRGSRDQDEPYLLTSTPNKKGYLVVYLCLDGKKHARLVHCLVLQSFIGPCPDGMQGCHSDGNPINNVVKNLRWGTPKQNTDDRKQHGKWKPFIGELHPRSKLTVDQVVAIRADTRLHKQIARDFDIDKSTVSDIKRHKIWRSVP